MTEGADATVRTREARPADADAVAAFTGDTWGEKHDDYIPRVFPEWVASDDPTAHTVVAVLDPDAAHAAAADADGVGEATIVEGPDGPEAVVGCVQGVLLSEWESWAQGIRVNPRVRGKSVSRHLSKAVFDWSREQGASVCRNMVFSWNVAGLGQSRAVGFEPATEFRFAQPTPDSDAASDLDATVAGGPFHADPDPNAAWSFWAGSDARDHLDGLALAADESWATQELTRERLADAAADDRLITVADDGIAGVTSRVRTTERDGDDGPETWAIYSVAAWRDPEAGEALLQAVARDAASVGADATRVLIPETPRYVSDVAAARVGVSEEPDFVMAADLTDPRVGRLDR